MNKLLQQLNLVLTFLSPTLYLRKEALVSFFSWFTWVIPSEEIYEAIFGLKNILYSFSLLFISLYRPWKFSSLFKITSSRKIILIYCSVAKHDYPESAIFVDVAFPPKKADLFYFRSNKTKKKHLDFDLRFLSLIIKLSLDTSSP